MINETVLAARDYLQKEGKLKNLGTPAQITIAKFLNWDSHRVKEALAEISDIEEEVVEKEVIDKLPSQAPSKCSPWPEAGRSPHDREAL